MTDVTVIAASEPSNDPIEPAVEVAAVEATAASAVEIAEVQADRDVRIEEIRAEVAADATEASVEIATEVAAAQSEGIEQCLTRVERVETALTGVQETLFSIQALLVRQEPELLSNLDEPAGGARTPESPEALAMQADAPPAPPRKRRLRLI